MRLIDADALIGNVFDEREKRGIGVLVATALIRHASVCPTIDAVEVVRCKDCKHWAVLEECGHYCSHWGNMMTDTLEDDFCSNGERREP